MDRPADSPAAGADAPTFAARRAAASLFVALAALYVLSGPGRIDIIDGQIRFDVTLSLLDVGRPLLRDPALRGAMVPGPDGSFYGGYGPAASVAALPLVWLGGALFDDPLGETRRFLFSHTNALFGAGLGVLLLLFYRDLGLGRRAAVGWTLAGALATLAWPLATSSFDQTQHAFWALLALWLAFRAGRRESIALALAGGLAAGMLLLYQEVYAVLIPALAWPAVGRDRLRDPRARARLVVFLLAAGIGLALWLQWNYWRFENPFMTGKTLDAGSHPGPVGNPLVGLPGLLLSPGKSVLLFSPTVLLAVFGFAGLRRREPRLAAAVAALAGVLLVVISSLSFYGGDWCWGPRYLLLGLVPLGLAYPWAREGGLGRRVVAGLVGLGLVVQLLALSLDHQRFFFERRLPPFFWAADAAYYFRESQLVARPGEIWRSLAGGVPEEAERFVPAPYQRLLTYCIFGSREALFDADWVRRFEVFHRPRPWPLWLPFVDRERYRLPVEPLPWTLGLVALLGLGAAGLGSELRRPET